LAASRALGTEERVDKTEMQGVNGVDGRGVSQTGWVVPEAGS